MYELNKLLQKLSILVFESIKKLTNLTPTWSNFPQSSCDSYWFQRQKRQTCSFSYVLKSRINCFSMFFLHKHYTSWERSHILPFKDTFKDDDFPAFPFGGICTVSVPWRDLPHDLPSDPTCILASKFCHSSCRTLTEWRRVVVNLSGYNGCTPSKNKRFTSIKKEDRGK